MQQHPKILRECISHSFFCLLFLFSPLLCSPNLQANPLDKEIDAFLQNYTTPRGVRYRALKNNARLKHLFGRLRNMPLPASRKAQEAYWINLYNIATIKLIADHYPIKSITDLHIAGSQVLGYLTGRTIWKTWTFSVRGKSMTLDKIEHGILRPKFRDFRIHAALVCAARSCPPLRREAYRGAILDRQLEEQMRLWLSDKSKNRYDAKTNTLYLSQIFAWFESDFVGKVRQSRIEEALHLTKLFFGFASDFPSQRKQKLLATIRSYFPDKTKIRVQKDQKTLQIHYLRYDWSLNKIK